VCYERSGVGVDSIAAAGGMSILPPDREGSRITICRIESGQGRVAGVAVQDGLLILR
jgi:hypothetical protein